MRNADMHYSVQAASIRAGHRGLALFLAALFLAFTTICLLPGRAFAAIDKPYFVAKGGDVVTGASFSTDTVPCTGAGAAPHVATAGILAWNNDGAPNYAGAGGQYAARALGFIQDFVTRQPAATAADTTKLSFSNVNTSGSLNPAAGLFGGMFGHAPCVDYWGAKPDLTDPTKVTSIGDGPVSGLDGTYAHTGSNLSIDASSIGDGQHIVLYVDGNVNIKGDIKYTNGDTGTWPDRKAIPSFRLIVHGSIFIDNAAKQLDGLYVAVPSTGGWNTLNTYSNPIPGTISTCSTGFVSYNPANYLTQKIEAACNNPLLVNGSFVAQQLWLLRSTGSLASNTPAEVFDYRPEMWLSGANQATIVVDSNYQSIIGLPPQL